MATVVTEGCCGSLPGSGRPTAVRSASTSISTPRRFRRSRPRRRSSTPWSTPRRSSPTACPRPRPGLPVALEATSSGSRRGGRRLRPGGARGLAIFASSADGFFRMLPLAESAADGGSRPEPGPAPLAVQLGRRRRPRCGRSRERGDLYRLDEGRLVEIVDETDEAPGRHDQGGWSQARYQRHIDHIVLRHLKRSATRSTRPCTAGGRTWCWSRRRSCGARSNGAVARGPRVDVGWTTAEAHATEAELLGLSGRSSTRLAPAQTKPTLERWQAGRGRAGASPPGGSRRSTPHRMHASTCCSSAKGRVTRPWSVPTTVAPTPTAASARSTARSSSRARRRRPRDPPHSAARRLVRPARRRRARRRRRHRRDAPLLGLERRLRRVGVGGRMRQRPRASSARGVRSICSVSDSSSFVTPCSGNLRAVTSRRVLERARPPGCRRRPPCRARARPSRNGRRTRRAGRRARARGRDRARAFRDRLLLPAVGDAAQ